MVIFDQRETTLLYLTLLISPYLANIILYENNIKIEDRQKIKKETKNKTKQKGQKIAPTMLPYYFFSASIFLIFFFNEIFK